MDEPIPITAEADATDRAAYGLLNRRVRLLNQPGRDRPAIDALFLAAAAPATGAAQILDAGCGSGAVALCVAARLLDARFTALDLTEAAVAETLQNVRANGWQQRFEVVCQDLASFRAQGFDLVLSNPPFHDPASTRAGRPDRDQARFGGMPLDTWLGHCLRLCRPRGHVVVILRGDRLVSALTALDARAGDLRILPLHSHEGQPASRVMIRARKTVRSPVRILPGLVLHHPDGSWTPMARRILVDAATIDWESGRIA